MVREFLRRTWNRYPKLGKGRKKKQVWRKPKGRDNKMREKRKGYPKVVSIGYKKKESEKPIVVSNVKELENLKGKEKVIVSNVGKKKKIDIAKKAQEKNISIENLNVKRFLKDIEKEKSRFQNKTTTKKQSSTSKSAPQNKTS